MSIALAVPILLATLAAAPTPLEPHLTLPDPLRAGARVAPADDPPAEAIPAASGSRADTLRFWGRTLRLGTAAALVATTTLGTIAAIDQPTAFGDGRCITGRPVLGDYGCDRGLSTLHGASGVVSATLYTANGVLALAAPESRGDVSPGLRPLHRALSWVHLGGIVIQPAIGLIAAYPQVVGRSRAAPTDGFPRNLRTAHVIIGYVTTLAFLSTVALEW